MKQKYSYQELMTFWGESAELDPLELYDEFRKYHPEVRTHYELLKKYIMDKHDLIYYEVQLKGHENVTDLCFGYLMALKEIRALIDACEYNMYFRDKLKRGT